MSRGPAGELARALDENDHTPMGPVRIARAERLVELVEAAGDRPLLVRALSSLVTAYSLGGEDVRTPVPFARMLAMWDADPGTFGEEARRAFHWQFKWITGSLLSHPDVPLAQISRWVDQMGSRYRQAGYSDRPVHQARFRLAQHVGDTAGAQEAFDGWRTSPRDEMADCEACELRLQGDWLVESGRDAEAVDVWGPVLEGDSFCAEEPAGTRAAVLLPLVRLGRLDEARGYHLDTYRLARGNQARCWIVQRNLVFATRTGNEARALEILARHAGWLGSQVDTPFTHAFWLAAAVNLLRRLEHLGDGGLPITAPAPAITPAATPAVAPGGTPTGTPTATRTATTTVAELRPRLEAQVVALGARFDARNSSAAVSGRLLDAVRAEPLIGGLFLGLRGSVPGRPGALGTRPPGDPAGEARPGAAAGEQPRSAAEELARAQELWLADGSEALAVDVAFRAAYLADGVDDALAGRARVLAARACGYLGRHGEAIALLEQVLPELDRWGSELERVMARRLCADSLEAVREPAEGARLLLEAASLAETWPDQNAHAELAHLAGSLLEQDGRFADAQRAFARAARLYRELGRADDAVRAVRAQAWAATGADPADWSVATALFDGLEREADRPDPDGDPAERAETRRQHAVLLLRRLGAEGDGPAGDGPAGDGPGGDGTGGDAGGTAERALALAEKAIPGFVEVGAAVPALWVDLLAAELELDHLGRPEQAAVRVRTARRRARRNGFDEVLRACDDLLDRVKEVQAQAP